MCYLEQVVKSLEEDFSSWDGSTNKRYLLHKESSIRLYIDGGEENIFITEPLTVNPSNIEKKALWGAVQKCCENILLAHCKKL
ncbi:hypothetical protein LCGC14_0929490 [marine sediment metagenome]|uniref:Uncharacterized protein n=1 Tax=marine sediment metagenome TaxID=412755 RepID=A0A0F9NSW7_9ZZZZ|nr:hypothetical protein [Candidatus Aminicenantes bacterium]